MANTIVSIGNGGFNIARDILDAGVLTDAKFIVCDTDAMDLAHNGQQADMTFLLDKTIDPKEFHNNVNLVRPITEEFNDELYIVAALGGWTTRLYAPLIATATEQWGKFIWCILTRPYRFEGEVPAKRCNDTMQWLSSFCNMTLLQDNDKLTDISGLSLEEINRPIVDTMSIVKLFDIRKSYRYTEDYTEYIPERYREAIRLYRNPWLFPPKIKR